VGVAIPLRGMGQAQIDCRLVRVAAGGPGGPGGPGAGDGDDGRGQSFYLFPPAHLPHLLELAPAQGGVRNKGYLLTSVFSVNVLNLQVSECV